MLEIQADIYLLQKIMFGSKYGATKLGLNGYTLYNFQFKVVKYYGQVKSVFSDFQYFICMPKYSVKYII